MDVLGSDIEHDPFGSEGGSDDSSSNGESSLEEIEAIVM